LQVEQQLAQHGGAASLHQIERTLATAAKVTSVAAAL
jgi:hypothetical protein